MSELDAILDAFAKKLAPLVAAELAQVPGTNPNELMTVSQIARELHLGLSKVRMLINSGTLLRAPDIEEMRVKRSEVEAYGTRL